MAASKPIEDTGFGPEEPEKVAKKSVPANREIIEAVHQGDDRYFVRYAVDGKERAHNVRISSLTGKAAGLKKALENAKDEAERARIGALADVNVWLLGEIDKLRS